MPTIVDLTALLGPNTCVYPADPPFSLTWHVGFADAGWRCSRLEMGPHSGTHVDAPAHFIEDGARIGETPLERFCGPALIVEALKEPGQDVVWEDLDRADIRSGDIVLVRTGWDVRIDTPRLFEGEWPGLDPEVVERLAERGVKAIGIDSPSVDSPRAIKAGTPAHFAALSRGMPVYETLANLDKALGRVSFYGLPLRLVEAEASPVRAIAVLP